MTLLELTQKYAGFKSVECDTLWALNALDAVRDATRDAMEQMKTPDEQQEELLNALSLVKRYLSTTRDNARSEMGKLRGELAKFGEE